MLPRLLESLTARARARGLTDAEWARRAGVRKETVSRLRGRSDCDLSTLQALAREVGATLALQEVPAAHAPQLDRAAEAHLVALAARGPVQADVWRAAGPAPFMAGLAVLMASAHGADRAAWLSLAEQLHPGSTRPRAFQAWLQRSPLKPSRFLPMALQARRNHA